MYFSAFAAGLACLVSVPAFAAAQSPTLPSQDVFYSQPANISHYEPGEVIRGRYVGNQIQGVVAGTTTGGAKSIYQYMYRTTDSVGQPVGAVMTYLVPNKPNNLRLLAYSVAYDAANNDCSVSYSIQPGANNSIGGETLFVRDHPNLLQDDERPLTLLQIQAALARGWHVVTSDYEGLDAHFVAGTMSGHAVLDSIRAAFEPSTIKDTGLSPLANYGMYGYSGGSLASEWAAELASSYAPELTRFVGAVLGGLEPNLTNVIIAMNKALPAGLVFSGTYGLAKAYKEFGTWLLDTQLKPEKKEQFYDIARSCNSQNGPKGMFLDYFSFMKSDDFMFEPMLTGVMGITGMMGQHAMPQMPLYIYKAVVDEASPIGDTDALVNQYCASGVNVKYWRNLFGEHIVNSFIGLPEAYAWLEDRFNGVPLAKSQQLPCDISTNDIRNVTGGLSISLLGIDITNALEKAMETAANQTFPFF